MANRVPRVNVGLEVTRAQKVQRVRRVLKALEVNVDPPVLRGQAPWSMGAREIPANPESPANQANREIPASPANQANQACPRCSPALGWT